MAAAERLYPGVPSGNDYQFAIENDPIEIVDFPISNGDFPQLCNNLPEGKRLHSYLVVGMEQFGAFGVSIYSLYIPYHM